MTARVLPTQLPNLPLTKVLAIPYHQLATNAANMTPCLPSYMCHPMHHQIVRIIITPRCYTRLIMLAPQSSIPPLHDRQPGGSAVRIYAARCVITPFLLRLHYSVITVQVTCLIPIPHTTMARMTNPHDPPSSQPKHHNSYPPPLNLLANTPPIPPMHGQCPPTSDGNITAHRSTNMELLRRKFPHNTPHATQAVDHAVRHQYLRLLPVPQQGSDIPATSAQRPSPDHTIGSATTKLSTLPRQSYIAVDIVTRSSAEQIH